MAKDSRSLSDSFETENTGGFLSALLAEEEDFDRRTLWRLGSWAAVTVGAVIVALLASQSSIGMRREQIASADLARQSQQIQTVAKESQSEARRLASAIETLNSDRDRLYSRVAVLEHGLDSATGAITRQNSTVTLPQAAAPPETPASTPKSSPASAVPPATATTATAASAITRQNSTVTSPQAAAPPETPASTPKSSLGSAVPPAAATTATAAPAITRLDSTVTSPQAAAPVETPTSAPKSSLAPAVSAVAVTTATTTPAAEKTPAASAPAEPGPAKASPAPPAASNAPAVTPATPLVAARSMMAPPDPAAPKLIEPSAPPKTVIAEPIPEVVALTSPAEEAAESNSASAESRLAVQRTEFGVDVGGANSLPGLRALWRGLLKSRSNAALTTLRPIIVIKEGSNGLGMQLRLVAGPISDAAAAAKICAGMIENDRSCATAVFEGQRLTMNANEPPAAPDPKPASVAKPFTHKRYPPKRAAKDEPDQKPEPSTLSLLFGRR
jgi:hypothetical protein